MLPRALSNEDMSLISALIRGARPGTVRGLAYFPSRVITVVYRIVIIINITIIIITVTIIIIIRRWKRFRSWFIRGYTSS